MRWCISLAIAALVPACIWQDVCVDGATRVDGRCMFVEDAGSVRDAGTDAQSDAGSSSDSGRDARVEDDAGEADAGVRHCVPAGSPVPITTGGQALEHVAVIASDSGYVVLWDGADRKMRYAITDASGVVTTGPSQLRSESTVTHSDASLTHVGDHAVALWSEGADVWGRAIPVDGSSASPAVSIAVGAAGGIAGTTAAPLTGGVRVVWRVEGEIFSAVYSGALASEIDPPSVVYTMVTPDAAANLAPALIHSPDESHTLLGFADQRAGDTGARAYVGRLELTPEGTWMPIGPALEGLSVHAAARPPTPDGVAAAFMTIARAPTGGTRRVDLVEIEPRDIGEDLRVVRTTPLASDDFFGQGAVAAAAAGFDVAWVTISGATTFASYAFVNAEGGVDGPHEFGTMLEARVAVARIDAERAAVAFIEGAGAGDLFLQRIDCE